MQSPLSTRAVHPRVCGERHDGSLLIYGNTFKVGTEDMALRFIFDIDASGNPPLNTSGVINATEINKTGMTVLRKK